MKNQRKVSGYLINKSYQGKFLIIFGGFCIMQIVTFFYAISSLVDQMGIVARRSEGDYDLLATQLTELKSNMFLIFGGSFLMLTALFLIVSFRFTHKTAGALFHFKNSFEAMGEEKKLKELKLRDGDFFRDVEKSFNDMIKKI